jgi:hypothetical protein
VCELTPLAQPYPYAGVAGDEPDKIEKDLEPLFRKILDMPRCGVAERRRR